MPDPSKREFRGASLVSLNKLDAHRGPPEAGRLLYALVRATRPTTVVEFGMSFGISAVHLASAVRDNGIGRVVTTELNASKIAAAKQTFAETGLDDLITILEGDALSTLAGLEGQVKGKGVRLMAELPQRLAPIEADPGKLKQILINLVGNAIKFTERANVTVRVETDPANGRPLALDVIDTGIGIPADKQRHIFDAFAQADSSTTRRYGGTGLGLVISKRLVSDTARSTGVNGPGSPRAYQALLHTPLAARRHHRHCF